MQRTSSPQAAEEIPPQTLAARCFGNWDAIVFVAAVWIVMFAQAIILPIRNKNNCPFWDEFEMVPYYTGASPVTASWLWACHNEHRIPLPKLVMLAVIRASGDFRAGGILNVLILGAISAALIFGAWRLRGQTAFADAVFPLLFLNRGQFPNLLETFQVSFVLPVLLMVAILLLIVRRRTLSAATAVVMACCLATMPLCGGPGLPFVPLLALWLFAGAVHGCRAGAYRSKRVALLMLLLPLLACVPTGLYFVGFKGANIPYAGTAATLNVSLSVLIVSIGIAARDYPQCAFCAVAVFCLASLLLIAMVWRRRPAERFRAAGLCLFLSGFAGTALSIGLARAGLGPMAGYAERYVTLMVPLLCGAYFIIILYASLAWARLLQMALLVVLLLVAERNREDCKAWCSPRQETWEHNIMADIEAGVPSGVLAERYYQTLYPDPGPLTNYLTMLREGGWPPFKGTNVMAFDSAHQVLLKLDRQNGFGGIEPLHDMVIHPQPNSLGMTCMGIDPYALLPEVSCPEQCDLVVRCDIVSPVASYLQLFYPVQSSQDYSPDHQVTKYFLAGRNTVYLRIPQVRLAGRIRLDPIAAPGEFILNSLEIRAVPAGK